MDFSFDPGHAREYGLEEAIVIRMMTFWIHKNKTDERNLHDDRTWTYNTVEGWAQHFPFWSKEQMRRIIDRMKAKQIVVTGNYNKTPMDRTVWYAFSDESIFLPRQMDLPKSTNGFGKIGDTIPVTNHVPTQRKSEPLPQDSPSVVLATLLLTEHRKVDAVFGKGKDEEIVQRWAKDVDKLLRLDGRAFEDVKSAILFSQASDFWCANVVSGEKLRKQFSTLIVQSKRTPKISAFRQEPDLFTPTPASVTAMTDRDQRNFDLAQREAAKREAARR